MKKALITKSKVTTQTSITQRLRTDLGRSVVVTTVNQLVTIIAVYNLAYICYAPFLKKEGIIALHMSVGMSVDQYVGIL